GRAHRRGRTAAAAAAPAPPAPPADPRCQPGAAAALWSTLHRTRRAPPSRRARLAAVSAGVARQARRVGPAHAGLHGLLRAARGRPRDRLSRRRPRLGGAPVICKDYDVVIVGSGAGGGTVAAALAPLVRHGKKILVVEKGPRLGDHEFT